MLIEVICTADDEQLDGTPGHLVGAAYSGCGRTFTVDAEGPWDVKTDAKGNILSRHRHVYCPDCGSATFIVESAE